MFLHGLQNWRSPDTNQTQQSPFNPLLSSHKDCLIFFFSSKYWNHLHVYPFVALLETKHLFPPPNRSLKTLVHTKEVRYCCQKIKYILLLSLLLFSLWGSLTSHVNSTSVADTLYYRFQLHGRDWREITHLPLRSLLWLLPTATSHDIYLLRIKYGGRRGWKHSS